MKRIVLLFAVFYLICSSSLIAQQIVEGHYGRPGIDVAYGTAATSDGGYIITGLTKSEADTNGDIVVIKVAPHGDTTWSHTYGGPLLEGGNFVMQLSGGGYMVCGHTQDFGAHDCDVYLMQLDQYGTFQWIKTYGGDSDDVGFSAFPLSSGGYIVGGMTESYGYADTGGGTTDHLYLIRTNSVGDTVWTKVYSGHGSEECFSLASIADSGILAVGYSSSFGSGEEDGWLLRVNPTNGDTLWTRLYKTIGNTRFNKILPTLDGGYMIAGSTTTFAGGLQQGMAVKLDANGNQQWQKTYSDATENVALQDVTQLPTGNYLFTGSKYDATTIGSIYLLTTDVNGVQLSDTTYGGENSYAYGIASQGNNSYMVVGSTAKYGDPEGDLYFLEMDNTVITQVPTVNATSARLYPNPIYGQPAIVILPQDKANENVDFEVMTTDGQVVVSEHILAKDILIDRKNFTPALYLFRITCKDGTVYKGKFVVE